MHTMKDCYILDSGTMHATVVFSSVSMQCISVFFPFSIVFMHAIISSFSLLLYTLLSTANAAMHLISLQFIYSYSSIVYPYALHYIIVVIRYINAISVMHGILYLYSIRRIFVRSFDVKRLFGSISRYYRSIAVLFAILLVYHQFSLLVSYYIVIPVYISFFLISVYSISF